MNYSPYTPLGQFNPSPYQMAMDEKHKIRQTANRTSFTVLASLLIVETVLSILVGIYARSGYFVLSTGSRSYGMPLILFYLVNDISYITMAIPPLIYFCASRMTTVRGLPFSRISPLTAIACIFFGTAVCQLANIPANFVIDLQEYFGFSGNLPQLPVSNDPLVLVLYFLFFSVIAPLVEEMIFRGAVLQSLRKYGDGFAVFCSALLFGLYHGNFVQMVFAFIAGLVMAYTDLRTNSLLPSLFIHFGNNFIAAALDLVQKNYGITTANNASSLIFLATVILGTVAFIYLLTKKKFFRQNKRQMFLPLSSRFSAFFSNPGVICMLLFSVISSITVLRTHL